MAPGLISHSLMKDVSGLRTHSANLIKKMRCVEVLIHPDQLSRLDLCERLDLVRVLDDLSPLLQKRLLQFWNSCSQRLKNPALVDHLHADVLGGDLRVVSRAVAGWKRHPWWPGVEKKRPVLQLLHFSVFYSVFDLWIQSLLCFASLPGNHVKTTTWGTFKTLPSEHNRLKKHLKGEFAEQRLYVVLLGPSVFVSQIGSHLPLWLSWLDFVRLCDLSLTHGEWRFYWPVASLR